jgi:hypothetical protein
VEPNPEPNRPLILDPGDPLPSARAFVMRLHHVDGVLALRHQAGLFHAYQANASAYGERDEAAVRAELHADLEAGANDGGSQRAISRRRSARSSPRKEN